MKITIKRKIWCFLDKGYYSNEKDGLNGEVVGESRDGKQWRVRMEGKKSIYNYPKEVIRLENPKLIK